VTSGPNSAFLAPTITDYLKQHPEVSLELVCTTRAVDLVEERFDLGIRAGTLPDSTLIARSLGRVSWWLVAAPAYLKEGGRPRSPGDLAKHDCLFFGPALGEVGPQLEKDGDVVRLTVSPRMTVTEMDILHAVAKTGLGIALLLRLPMRRGFAYPSARARAPRLGCSVGTPAGGVSEHAAPLPEGEDVRRAPSKSHDSVEIVPAIGHSVPFEHSS
jgi:DNA-binding transcriptional LysR family regulator